MGVHRWAARHRPRRCAQRADGPSRSGCGSQAPRAVAWRYISAGALPGGAAPERLHLPRGHEPALHVLRYDPPALSTASTGQGLSTKLILSITMSMGYGIALTGSPAPGGVGKLQEMPTISRGSTLAAGLPPVS